MRKIGTVFPGGTVVKNLPVNAGDAGDTRDMGSIPGSRSTHTHTHPKDTHKVLNSIGSSPFVKPGGKVETKDTTPKLQTLCYMCTLDNLNLSVNISLYYHKKAGCACFRKDR